MRMKKDFITIQHDYHDHSLVVESIAAANVVTEESRRPPPPFPIKHHQMLEYVDADGNAHVVSCQPHGRCFVVHQPEAFKEILPRYFKLSKIASFQRQLNLYGFQRLARGPDKGGYLLPRALSSRQDVFVVPYSTRQGQGYGGCTRSH